MDGSRNAVRYSMSTAGEALHHPSPAMTTQQFQIICLNKNNDAVKVLRVLATSAAEAKKQFMLQGAPVGTTSFRVVPLDR